MSTRARGYRNAARVVLLLVACAGLASGCQRPAAVIIDLLHELPNAERRARGNLDDAIKVDRDTLVLQSPARVTWMVRMPRPARFLTSVTLLPSSAGAAEAVVIRLGVATPRQYQDVSRVRVEPSEATAGAPWRAVAIDLGAYSGPALSLFYHPAQIVWKLILNADALPGGTVALAAPRIEMR